MSELDKETRQIIDRLRQQRATLGDLSRPRIAPVRYKRLSKPFMARVVIYGYVFLMGMLFGAFLQGNREALIGFGFITVAFLYSIWKE